MQRTLTDAERAELNALTAAVEAALDARTAWLDRMMIETSELKPGDDVYDLQTGERAGVVISLYRYAASQGNRLADTGPLCDYKFETAPRCFDNTSRQPGRQFGTRAQALDETMRRVQALAARI